MVILFPVHFDGLLVSFRPPPSVTPPRVIPTVAEESPTNDADGSSSTNTLIQLFNKYPLTHILYTCIVHSALKKNVIYTLHFEAFSRINLSCLSKNAIHESIFKPKVTQEIIVL